MQIADVLAVYCVPTADEIPAAGVRPLLASFAVNGVPAVDDIPADDGVPALDRNVHLFTNRNFLFQTVDLEILRTQKRSSHNSALYVSE